jgi:pimeloyl-ACP methyl ester carboxylesterase
MSLAFHLAHPERTLALLIIDTGPGYKSDAPREGWNATAIARAERFEKDGLPPPGVGGAETRAAPHRNADGLARAARGMLTQKDARVISSLPEIKVPALVVVGSEDKPFLAASDYMAAKIPGARKVVIDGAGHAANIDRPEAFNSAVLDFLDELALVRA